MSIIKDWSSHNAYQNMTPEAKALLGKYNHWCDECTASKGKFICKEKKNASCRVRKEKLRIDILDITDIGTVCVVFDKKMATVRRFLIVSDDAEERLDELKDEFYAANARCPDDEFRFCKGLHRALEYAESVWIQSKEEVNK